MNISNSYVPENYNNYFNSGSVDDKNTDKYLKRPLNDGSEAITASWNTETREPSIIFNRPSDSCDEYVEVNNHQQFNFNTYTISPIPVTERVHKVYDSSSIINNEGELPDIKSDENISKAENSIKSIDDIIRLLKSVCTLTASSESKNDKNSLKLLLTPKEVKDENGINYNNLMNFDAYTEIRGAPLPNMKMHSLKPGTEPEVQTIYSYRDGEEDWAEIRIAFGLLKSGDPFHFQYRFDRSRFELDYSNLFVAPDWCSLIDNLSDFDLYQLVRNMSKENSELLSNWLFFDLSVHPDEIRDILKVVFNSDLLDKCCQQVINH
ncbi:hypothetical protein [Endozoicomonas sp. SCSIO W0465]|uniref:hypothetical protein n=1 Tax=Endozoicomonas sp. SCSIO W0465 TaxID=2918516 RepID=UPI0020762D2C|nr:hypothetical protein [Endozoicomonas sp. SCSIO W0465]USE37097.1 hypothetical protein MJO57_02375 [Endozoicomonas sp. SCSIO W0465]